MVMLLLDTADEFICISIAASEDRGPPVGERSRSAPERLFGGRDDTQSWTRSDTCGLRCRFSVFLESGFDVMIMVGPWGICVAAGGKECEGR
jgi:hypothetical protein